MEYVIFFWVATSFSVTALIGNKSVEYEYEFKTFDHVKESNATMMREPCEYLCRYTDDERIKICKEALQHEFAVKHGFKYDENGKLGKEKMYAFKVNSGFFLVDYPLIISACTCPTIPPIYLMNKFQGFDVIAYVEMAAEEQETSTSNDTLVP